MAHTHTHTLGSFQVIHLLFRTWACECWEEGQLEALSGIERVTDMTVVLGHGATAARSQCQRRRVSSRPDWLEYITLYIVYQHHNHYYLSYLIKKMLHEVHPIHYSPISLFLYQHYIHYSWQFIPPVCHFTIFSAPDLSPFVTSYNVRISFDWGNNSALTPPTHPHTHWSPHRSLIQTTQTGTWARTGQDRDMGDECLAFLWHTSDSRRGGSLQPVFLIQEKKKQRYLKSMFMLKGQGNECIVYQALKDQLRLGRIVLATCSCSATVNKWRRGKGLWYFKGL